MFLKVLLSVSSQDDRLSASRLHTFHISHSLRLQQAIAPSAIISRQTGAFCNHPARPLPHCCPPERHTSGNPRPRGESGGSVCRCKTNQTRILEVAFCAGTKNLLMEFVWTELFFFFTAVCAPLQCITAEVISPSCSSAGVYMFTISEGFNSFLSSERFSVFG